MRISFSASRVGDAARKEMNNGFITGSKTKILGTNTYLYTMLLYDDKGRLIQAKSTNITGGTDVITTQYGWQGLPLITVVKTHNNASPPSQSEIITTVTKNTYDILGRITKTEKKQSHNLVNGGTMSAYQTISQLEYDALGQVKEKKLAPAYNNNTGLENIAFDYNIRGWLLGANRDFIRDVGTANYFGFDLGYDKNGVIGSYAKQQYNGNIGGTIWKSKGDGQKRKYDFDYDAVKRILSADFNQYTSGSFSKTAGVDFSMSNMSYDANGNIMSMNQKGLKINTSPLIDQLAYTYQTNSNKLSKVVDAVVDKDSKLGDFKYDPATKGSTDYSYDANGNLTLDNNKKISSITYNYLNLPSVIPVTGKGTITYTYDATGNKLKKVTVDNTVAPSKTTTTLYIGGAVYENDVLQFIAHEEGRIRPVRDANNDITSFIYDYFLKDHLGNIRMVLTEEQKQDLYPLASLETSKVAIEKNYYDIQDANIVDKSMATGITNYQNNNGISNNPPDSSFETTISQKLYKLNSNSAKTGLGITLKVMADDKIDVFGKSYYFQNTSGQGGNSTIPILDLLTAFLGSPSSPVSVHGLTAEALNIPAGILGITSLLTNQSNQSNASPNKPRAFINVVFFDEQFKSYDYRLSMVGSNSVVKDHYSELQNIAAGKSGYVFIYCSNESPVNVFFDNLQVVHTRGAMLEENHYYPFGLTMAGISSKAVGSLENKTKFNGKELNEDLDLDWYEYGFRNNFDPQLGRFHSVDPLASDYPYYTPYQFAGNQPTIAIDVDGLEPAFVNDIMTWLTTETVKKPNGAAAVTLGVVAGTGKFAEKTITGVANLVTSPPDLSPHGLANSGVQMGLGVFDRVNTIQNGSTVERTAAITETVLDVVSVVVGTKGAGAALKGEVAAGKAASTVETVSPNVKKVLNTLNEIKAEGGTVKPNPLKSNQELNLTVQKGTSKVDLRVETGKVSPKYGGNGTTPQRHMNVDLFKDGRKVKNVLPNNGHKILE